MYNIKKQCIFCDRIPNELGICNYCSEYKEKQTIAVDIPKNIYVGQTFRIIENGRSIILKRTE